MTIESQGRVVLTLHFIRIFVMYKYLNHQICSQTYLQKNFIAKNLKEGHNDTLHPPPTSRGSIGLRTKGLKTKNFYLQA